jgi:GWxTD domain-containing protein
MIARVIRGRRDASAGALKEDKVKKIKMNIFIAAAAIIITFTMVSCGGVSKKAVMDPVAAGEDEFFETTRYIMLKNEIKIYKHLPDQESRDSFKKEFWRKRDPNPETQENEARNEFYQRIAFVNRWFSEKTGKNRGLDSDRGKVYLYLGPPDERTTQQRTVYNSTGTRVRILTEQWLYQRHLLFLEFRDVNGFGVYQLARWSPELLTAIDSEKFTIFENKDVSKKLKFKAAYKDGEIQIRIPVKGIVFDEEDGKMKASFKVKVYVYHEYKKIDELEKTWNLAEGKENILKKDNVAFVIPYTASSKGKYYFDIIVKDLASTSSYRNMIRFKS